jgi:hypothetical protein
MKEVVGLKIALKGARELTANFDRFSVRFVLVVPLT